MTRVYKTVLELKLFLGLKRRTKVSLKQFFFYLPDYYLKPVIDWKMRLFLQKVCLFWIVIVSGLRAGGGWIEQFLFFCRLSLKLSGNPRCPCGRQCEAGLISLSGQGLSHVTTSLYEIKGDGQTRHEALESTLRETSSVPEIPWHDWGSPEMTSCSCITLSFLLGASAGNEHAAGPNWPSVPSQCVCGPTVQSQHQTEMSKSRWKRKCWLDVAFTDVKLLPNASFCEVQSEAA